MSFSRRLVLLLLLLVRLPPDADRLPRICWISSASVSGLRASNEPKTCSIASSR